jgi:hypothetical protein
MSDLNVDFQPTPNESRSPGSVTRMESVSPTEWRNVF